MKLIFSILLIVASSFVHGQINFRTGDPSLEAELNIVNNDAKRDLRTFKSNISVQYGIPVPRVEGMLNIMKPAEVLLAIRISSISKKPLDVVVQNYKTNKDKGWGYIAKQMGIKPGSPEFHALKGKSKKGGNAKPKSSGKPSSTKGNNGKSNGKK